MTAPSLRSDYATHRYRRFPNWVDHSFRIALDGDGEWVKHGRAMSWVEGTLPTIWQCGLCGLTIPQHYLIEHVGYDPRCPEVLAGLPSPVGPVQAAFDFADGVRRPA